MDPVSCKANGDRNQVGMWLDSDYLQCDNWAYDTIAWYLRKWFNVKYLHEIHKCFWNVCFQHIQCCAHVTSIISCTVFVLEIKEQNINSNPSKFFNFEFSKYSIIWNKFGTHWIQRIGPTHDILITVYNSICFECVKSRFLLRVQNIWTSIVLYIFMSISLYFELSILLNKTFGPKDFEFTRFNYITN